MRKLRQIEDKNSNNIIHKSLKDIKLPDFILNNPTQFYKYNLVPQHQGEPDQHYYFKLRLGYELYQYIHYNRNPLINKNIEDNPFFSQLYTSMIYYEKPHTNVKVIKVNELVRQRRDGQYYYTTDIWWKIKWNLFHYDILIEINGGIHTKNSEQMTNNRIRYNQIKEYYDRRNFLPNNKSIITKMIMIVFESDEWKYHKMQYFIDIIINTIIEGKNKYPSKFLFEL